MLTGNWRPPLNPWKQVMNPPLANPLIASEPVQKSSGAMWFFTSESPVGSDMGGVREVMGGVGVRFADSSMESDRMADSKSDDCYTHCE